MIMKKFRLTADITFDAEDLEDAFKELKEHFEMLESGNATLMAFEGEMKLETE